jgi:hypothetical protein
MNDDPKKEPTLDDLYKEAVVLLTSISHTLKGLLIEMKGANRRHMDASDFNINEFRRLSDSLDRMAAQFEKRK